MSNNLIVVTGPVASGKSTVSIKLADLARERGLKAAAVDIDDVVHMVAGRNWRGVNADDWHVARRVTAGLIESLFLSGIELVALAAPLFYAEDRGEVLQALTCSPAVQFVSLRVSFDEALRRATEDPAPDRVLTRDPVFLRQLHDSIEWQRAPEGDIVVQTDHTDTDTIALAVLSEVIDA